MANRLPHLALRINTNPLNPNLGVIATVILAQDDPRNRGTGSRFQTLECVEEIVRDSQVTMGTGPDSPSKRLMKGKGKFLQYNITASWYTGNKPPLIRQQEGEYGSFEEDIDVVADVLSRGMTNFNDGFSRYIWVTPNYNWITPAEQWVRMIEAPGTFATPYSKDAGGKVFVRSMSVVLVSYRNYLDIRRSNFRRGFVYIGAGTVSLTNGSKAVVGVGPTTFLRDFIHLDFLQDTTGIFPYSPGNTLGVVDFVTTDAAMQLKANFTGITGAYAYKVYQRSCQLFSVPIYTFTPFAPDGGWGVSPWGDNWGN